ncbi:MAG TPA: hypothetical protein VEH84_02445 [Alphaproteobacteria bacterium]|nr:hypothetical protein [Alphaproteobacteria bacterium]
MTALAILLHSGGVDRVHYALSLAAAALALDRPVTVLVAGRAVPLLLAGTPERPGWHGLDPDAEGRSPAARDAHHAARGIATFAQLAEACAALGGRFVACDMALRAEGLEGQALRTDLAVEIGGLVGLLADSGPDAQLVFV